MGQKQRLSITRTILNKPQVYFFDEVTSNLDSISERVIIDIMKELVREAIVIVIAHRLTTLVNCDCIYVMEDGAIVEQGNHDELMAHNGAYKRFYRRHMADSG